MPKCFRFSVGRVRISPDTGRQTESPTLTEAGGTAVWWRSVRDSIRAAGCAHPPGAPVRGRRLAGSPVPGALGPVGREAWPSRTARPGMDADSAREETA
ncbi:hypothetical protein GCM10009525_88410 [Streptosporangium amethystogenes subsp. fukuiense]